jgi:excisionase family DNA binding protein
VSALLTVAALAAELGVRPRWVTERIAAGELRAVRSVGRGYRVRRDWLDAFLAAREVQPAAPAAPAPLVLRVEPGRRTMPATGAPFRSLRDARDELLPRRGRSS